MKTWKTVSQKEILHHSKFLSVESHVVELPDGQIISNWPWIITPDFVNVLAETRDNTFLCFRQTKYGIDGYSLAPVGGYIEPTETPLAAAKRELLEETGYKATDWIELGRYRLDPNRGVAVGYLYLARNAIYSTESDSDDLEEQELLTLSLNDLEAAISNQEFKVMAWNLNAALALMYIKQEEKEKK